MRGDDMSDGNGDRYRVAKALVHQALDLPAEAREAFVLRSTAGDDDLRAEVRWMLDAVEVTRTVDLPNLREPAVVELEGVDASATAPRRYRIGRKLGEGGMGVVHLAERSDGGFAQQVALKFIHAHAEARSHLLERFAQERALLARLEHPGIARMLDGGLFEDGRPFIALEYVDGERIDTYCERHALSLRDRLLLFLKVCAAVDYAHGHLIIHRDIKPANILVGSDGLPKLLDFGIARVIGTDGDVERTATMHQAMTLAYASPEQIEKRTLTTAADVYSLGVVLYRLIAGSRPFQHIATPRELYNAIVGGDVVAPSRQRDITARRGSGAPRWRGLRRLRTIPADLDAIVLKAMRRRPEDRYASVAAFVADIHAFLDTRPVQARRGRLSYRAQRFIQRNRWSIVAGSVVSMAILGGLVASLLALARAREQQQLAQWREAELERAVRYQQSLLESVDIDAMGHSIDVALRDALRRTVNEGPASAALEKALSLLTPSDIAREAVDRHIVSHALERLDAQFPDDGRLAADIRQSLARVLVTIGNGEDAIVELHKVIDWRAAHGATEADLLGARIDLGRALLARQSLPEAAAIFAKAAAETAHLPDADPLKATATAGLAQVMARQGQLNEALAVQQRLVERLAAVLGPTDPLLMRARREMAGTLIQVGRRDEARATIEPLVAQYRAAGDGESPEALDTMSSLASVLNSSNEYERSLAVARDVVAIRTRRFGADHPATLRDAMMVAMNLMRLRAYGESRRIFEHILAVRTATLGPDNPDTLETMSQFIWELSFSGDTRAAAAMERRLVEARIRVLGPDHPDTLFAEGGLAGFTRMEGHYAEALGMALSVLERQRRVLGPDHPIGSGTLDLIARIYQDAGDWKDAAATHGKALEQRVARGGRLDSHTLESAVRYYGALMRSGDVGKAAEIRKVYLDPLLALDPRQLNESLRFQREAAGEEIAKARPRSEPNVTLTPR
jgi:serine/threonine-protein kinase